MAALPFWGSSCCVVSVPYDVTKGTVKATYTVTKVAAKTAIGAGKTVYKVGEFVFSVTRAPMEWPMTLIESISRASRRSK